MSKMDDLRAMREARFAQNAARAKQASGTGPTKAARPPVAPVAPVAPPAAGAARPPKAKPVTARRAAAPALSVVPDPPEVVVDDMAADDADEAPAALCGHKAISGKTCTREKGHTAKSHRYS